MSGISQDTEGSVPVRASLKNAESVLKFPACRSPATSLKDGRTLKFPTNNSVSLVGTGIPAPARHARAPLVELHRQHQMDEIAAVRIEDVPGDIPLVQPLHDDDLGRGRRIGLAGGQCFVVGPDRLFPLPRR